MNCRGMHTSRNIVSKVYFIGDLHFGHTGIHKFRTDFPSEDTHNRYIKRQWNERVTKRDCVFVMGDAAFTKTGLIQIEDLPGHKILVRGNHDTLPTEDYLSVFKEVHGVLTYKEFWLSHVPIHPTELYGRSSIHGHCHRGGPQEIVTSCSTLRGQQVGSKATYFNTCAEHLPEPYTPITIEQIREIISERIRKGV